MKLRAVVYLNSGKRLISAPVEGEGTFEELSENMITNFGKVVGKTDNAHLHFLTLQDTNVCIPSRNIEYVEVKEVLS